MAPVTPARRPEPARLVGIAAVVIVMVSLLVMVAPMVTPERPPAPPPAARAGPPGNPIPAEAFVFQTRPEDLAVAEDAPVRRGAQPRTMAIYRRLRAYPGAPPRIPHGVTDEEFREIRCNSCHERGGYVERFGGYVPVTPHPQYSACLQCHAADAMRVGIALPDGMTDHVCSQCHVDPDQPPPSLVALDWAPAPWPDAGFRAMEGSPPVIPHDLLLRENCVACHAGRAAVPTIRTTHPERANCRQCHVSVEQPEGEFVREPSNGAAGGDERPLGAAP